MTAQARTRDYSLVGKDSQQALEKGLASAEWYTCPIPRQRLKELVQRKDGPAIRDTALWIGCFVIFGGLACLTWPSWLSVPLFMAYGVLYGSSSDSRWHECGHRTAFKTQWMNDVVYHIASFMIMREPTLWRWSHTRHHTDTIIVGRDPEIAVMRPTVVLKVIAMFFAIPQTVAAIKNILRHAAGRLGSDEATFIPAAEQSKVFVTARIWLIIHLSIIGGAIYFGSLLPLLLAGPLPTMYGAWLHVLTGITQHAGLAEDVLDHRLNSRTVHMNPVMRFLYWNMNYHIEHHMFPMVPYHALPRLHEEMKQYCPPPYPSILAAYREIVPALLRQRREPQWHVVRELPAQAAVSMR
ncbi:MAG TPA: fatty acid desaturase family protein [Aestuariivirgaceae bacterium]|jgi:fatty acid desaturase